LKAWPPITLALRGQPEDYLALNNGVKWPPQFLPNSEAQMKTLLPQTRCQKYARQEHLVRKGQVKPDVNKKRKRLVEF